MNTESLYHNLLKKLSGQEIADARKNRDWSRYDSLKQYQKKEVFIEECRDMLGDLSEFKERVDHLLISKDGVILFGKCKGKHVDHVDYKYLQWAIKNIDGFQSDYKLITQ